LVREDLQFLRELFVLAKEILLGGETIWPLLNQPQDQASVNGPVSVVVVSSGEESTDDASSGYDSQDNR
jgi:hypothetical protein